MENKEKKPKNYLNGCYFKEIKNFPFPYEVKEPYGSIFVTIPKISDLINQADSKGRVSFKLEDVYCTFDTNKLLDKVSASGQLRFVISKRKAPSEYGDTHYAYILDDAQNKSSDDSIIQTPLKDKDTPF